MADDAELDGDLAAVRKRRRRLARLGGGSAAVLILALGAAWVERVPIADHFIAGALQDRGVTARYRLTQLSLSHLTIEDLALGNSARPDLTMRRMIVEFDFGLLGPHLDGIRADGVRLRGRVHDGALDLGDVSKLMPSGGGKAALPDLRVQLSDAQATLASDEGALSLTLAGSGNLQSGFAGDLGVKAPSLAMNGCTLDGLDGPLKLSTQDGAAMLKGPLGATQLACAPGGYSIAAPRLDVDLRGDPALEKVSIALSFAAKDAQQGTRRLTGLSGLLTAKGSGTELKGDVSLAAASTALGGVDSDTAKFGGSFALRPEPRDRAFSLSATMTAQDLRATDPKTLAQWPVRLAGTPVAPLAAKLVRAIERASGANRLTLSGRLDGDGQITKLFVNGARFDAKSGAHAGLEPGSELRADLSRGTWQMRGSVAMRGGGLPRASAEFVAKPDGALAGTLTMADYRAESARLAFAPVRITRNGKGAVRLRTIVSLDGPLGDGAVSDLSVPLDAYVTTAGAVRFAQDCSAVHWAALRVGAADFGDTGFDLCGLRKETPQLGAVTLAGRMGESPLRLKVDSARYALAAGRFDISGLDARIGEGENPVHVTAAALDGALGGEGGLAGQVSGATAVIGPVPLDLTRIAGQWHFADGALALDGSLRVSDRLADRRFNPLTIPDAHLRLVDGKIDATGTLTHPTRKAAIAKVTIHHDLSDGVGEADFALDDLKFGDKIQPDDLTPLALGVVANVYGGVDGKGAIRWSSAGVTASTGIFSTKAMDFAAAFGPVSGLATTIDFTDLLGMKTAPHQRLTVKQVSAGIDVYDGVIDYALLSKEDAQIEDGRWPFSGGTLELLPATLALDSHKPRKLAFRVIGLDAGAFINTLQLDNISATGTFDGVFPMIFDASGGRIDGGILVARQPGRPPLKLDSARDPLPPCDTALQAGTLSYVGGVSNAALGTMGKLAFGALKNLRYKCLTIHLDGALDGEFVTRVAINGINEGTEEAKKSFIARPFLGLPFVFNVRIEAPFRGLLNSAAAFADPTSLIRAEIARQNGAKQDRNLAVQPTDSDKASKGNGK